MTTTTFLERRGRRWMALSFLACPCHLPLTFGILATVLGGSTLAVALRDNTIIAGLLVTAIWLAGTARGLLLVRQGQRTGFACTAGPTVHEGAGHTGDGAVVQVFATRSASEPT